MKFSFEVPLNHLIDFHDLQDFHFTLSILYEHQTYQEYIRFIKQEGLSQIWLDNSYNEKMKADEVETLVLIRNTYGASRVIAPDSPSWDIQQISDAYHKTVSRLNIDSVIVVVRNQEMYYELRRQGALHFAVSYHSRREGFTEGQLYKIPNLHFLGLLTPEEIRLCQPSSCDTSIPIKLALKHIRLDDWVEMGCPHIHTKDLGTEGKDFFHSSMTPFQIKLARTNIKRLKEVCNG